jgi:hypothetical protein
VGTLGLAGAALAQLGLCSVAGTLLFGSAEPMDYFFNELQRGTIAGLTIDELSRRAPLAASSQNGIFNRILVFIAADLVEKTLKCLPIAYARRRGTPEHQTPRDRAYLDYALAGALICGVVECIGSTYGVCVEAQNTLRQLLVMVFERVIIGSPGHALLGSLTALRAIRKDYCGEKLSWWSVIAPSEI